MSRHSGHSRDAAALSVIEDDSSRGFMRTRAKKIELQDRETQITPKAFANSQPRAAPGTKRSDLSRQTLKEFASAIANSFGVPCGPSMLLPNVECQHPVATLRVLYSYSNTVSRIFFS